ncbi:MAG: MurT ligase domain-containing protein [Candidatus Coprovivens sp.]
MRIRFFVFINKFITFICKLFKRNGSVYPGYIVYDVFRQKKILEYVKYPKYVIAVTGSSGKGSTTDLINHILTDNGFDVCYNQNGSNGVLAATTLILNNCNSKGELKHDVLLLECDERHLKLIFGKNKMTHLIITNVTRDQPARNGHPDVVFNDIIKAIGKDTKLYLNADDPLVHRLKLDMDNDVVTFGVSKTDDSYIKSNINAIDYAYCPNCHKKLEYSFYHYGHIGNYSCKTCSYARGKVDYDVTKVDFDKKLITINDKDVYLNKGVLYAVYYTVAAYALVHDFGISEENILKALNVDKKESKRGKELKLDNRNLTMLETKNENNLSYYQSIRYIINQRGKKTVILGFDNVSRRYKFNDLSWLWDVDFELLDDKNIDKIFVIGRFKYDILNRLEFTNIDKDKIVLVDDLNSLIHQVKNDSVGDIYTMVCFDMTANILKLIKDDENENN